MAVSLAAMSEKSNKFGSVSEYKREDLYGVRDRYGVGGSVLYRSREDLDGVDS